MEGREGKAVAKADRCKSGVNFNLIRECRPRKKIRQVWAVCDLEATLRAGHLLHELGALSVSVDGLGTFLEIDSKKSHCN